MIIRCKGKNPKRDIFFSKLDDLSYEALIHKFAPDSLSNMIANIIKPLLGKMGVKDSKLLVMVKKYRVKKNSK